MVKEREHPKGPYRDRPVVNRAQRRAQYARERAGKESELALDVTWVYQHIHDTSMTKESAISLGAWGLLDWARTHKHQFFEKVLPRALVAKEKLEGGAESEQRRVEEMAIEELERTVKKLDEGTTLFYCGECWRQLEPGMECVEVTRKKMGEK
jgi:hypothetical protein